MCMSVISGALVNLAGDGRVTGSGFIVDTQGHIITNNHVASEHGKPAITFSDRRRISIGKLVGAFAAGDIAMIQVTIYTERCVQPVELGDSGSKVGQVPSRWVARWPRADCHPRALFRRLTRSDR